MVFDLLKLATYVFLPKKCTKLSKDVYLGLTPVI